MSSFRELPSSQMLAQVSWMTSSAQAELGDGRKSNGRLGIGMFGL